MRVEERLLELREAIANGTVSDLEDPPDEPDLELERLSRALDINRAFRQSEPLAELFAYPPVALAAI